MNPNTDKHDCCSSTRNNLTPKIKTTDASLACLCDECPYEYVYTPPTERELLLNMLAISNGSIGTPCL